MAWDTVLRQWLFEPLGMKSAFTLAEDIAGRHVAVGHIDVDGQPKPIPTQLLPRALGPAGFTLMTTPSDLVKLGRVVLDRGVASSGKQVLSSATVAAMIAPAIALPDGSHWGLGWKLELWGDELVISHDGGVMGQAANLWIVPDTSPDLCAMRQWRSLRRIAPRVLMLELFAEYGLREPELPKPDIRLDFDLARYEGRFENLGITLDFTRVDGGLQLHGVQKQFATPPVDLVLNPLDKERFATRMGGSQPIVMSFSEFDDRGAPQLFYAGRLHRRTA